ncbi:hypothetical protein [Methanocaldococcus fervens]|uniref:Uncharacterized protein n=1 Tax=Methanocaldococcus fervens (strain DSM 4213 / JCM 15782 / AG86) TaxID=573064 RepID=C7P7B1_METFA|nr:hypothetical protein [Methanocaldococcus fervens]ACV24443.1 hypothetical protein Mefer_0622 [Methanocaldococcus fervens AG86]
MKKLFFVFVIICLLLVGKVFGENYDFTTNAEIEGHVKILDIEIYRTTLSMSGNISVGESKIIEKSWDLSFFNFHVNLLTLKTTVSAEQIGDNKVRVTIIGSTSGISTLLIKYYVTYDGTVNEQPPDENYRNTLIWYFEKNSNNNERQNNNENNGTQHQPESNETNNQQTQIKLPIPLPAIIIALSLIPIIALRKLN